ncbi:unnamed protein product [Caenorhabditis bovis]|uniref:Fucosyltransferase n=1 Tax=Caenorhabditis bovis TaxID=2654633 RepID=A0A8S1ENT4_9PELO|nr:unnamed protein product [Caenorhabditis bovis]
MISRGWFARWKYLFILCCICYILVFYVPSENVSRDSGTQYIAPRFKFGIKNGIAADDHQNESDDGPKETFMFRPASGEAFEVEEVLTTSNIKLAQRMKCNPKKGKRVILSWNVGHSPANLGGCPEWNCEFTTDKNRVKEADAVLVGGQPYEVNFKPNAYSVYFSQESPKNSGSRMRYQFNMTLGFRHDTPASSPYGYTVKLAKSSWKTGELVDMNLIRSKKKPAAWFVSHCATNSGREEFIQRLQKHVSVDIYGGCGKLKCPKSGNCENALDTDYFFYVAFENSLCKDYNTEKLWNQGYQRTIIPLVMKRSIVEPFVPPNSFIAIDDFKSVKEMGDYLNYLMNNQTAYLEYFNWRRKYKVIFLNGVNHDVLERPWGFCQLCRILWNEPREHHVIDNWAAYWDETCERDKQLVNSISD